MKQGQSSNRKRTNRFCPVLHRMVDPADIAAGLQVVQVVHGYILWGQPVGQHGCLVRFIQVVLEECLDPAPILFRGYTQYDIAHLGRDIALLLCCFS
jgi:hypothetical protein